MACTQHRFISCRASTLSLWIAALAALPVAAQEQEQEQEQEKTDNPITLDIVQVLGAVPNEGAAPERERRALPYPSTGLERDVIEQVPDRRLGGALQRLPGVTMGGAPGERKDVRLRAIDKKYTRTEFGGVQLTDGGEKREFQVFRFPSFLAGEVKVIRNSTAEFEADGLAGRIQVDFREIPTERTVELSAATGTATDQDFGDQRSFQVAYGDRFGDFGMQLAFSRVADPLVKLKEKLKGTERETEEELKDLTFTDGFGDFAWYGDNQTLKIRPLVLNLEEDKDKEKRKFKDGALDKIETEVEDELKRTKSVIVDHEWRFSGGAQLDTIFAWSDTDEDKDKNKVVLKADGSLDKTETETEDKEDETFEIKTAATAPFNLGVDHQVKVGGAARVRDRFKDKTKLETKDGVVSDKTEGKDNVIIDERYLAAFVQDTITLGHGVSLTAGVRFEHVDRETEAGDGTSAGDVFADVLPSIHARWLYSDRITLRASVSQVLNRPKFDQLGGFSEEKGDDIIQGNPDLEPSKAWAFDVGASYTTPGLFFGINLFRREAEDIIEQVDTGEEIDGMDVFRFENVGDGHVQGIELEERVNLGGLGLGLPGIFELRANQTINDSELFDEFTERTRRFNESANLAANVGLYYSYAPNGPLFSVNGNFQGEERKTEEGKDETTDGEWTLDVYAETPLHKHASLFFTGENLTDTERLKTKGGGEEIETETTGRVFLIGLKAKF